MKAPTFLIFAAIAASPSVDPAVAQISYADGTASVPGSQRK